MSFVYIMRNGEDDVVKIGKAQDIEVRRGQFKTGNLGALTVVDGIETEDAGRLETFLHRILQSKRLRREFFALTPAQVEEAGRQARRYLADHLPAEKVAKQLARAECETPARPPSDRERELHRELLEKRETLYRAEVECAHIENELKVAIGTSEGLEGLASWRTHTVARLDEAAFRREHPDIHAAFSRPTRQRTFRLLWS